MRYAALVFSALVLVSGCKQEPDTAPTATATPSTAQCSKDMDCKGDRICDKGVCAAPAAATGPLGATPAAALMTVSPFDVEGGEVKLGNGNQLTISGDTGSMELRYGPTILRDEMYMIGFEMGFDMGDKQVVLVSISEGGNACPAMYLLVETTPLGSSKVTDDFGTCSDEPVIKAEGDEIVITMAGNDGDRTYIYRDSKLTES